MDIETVIQILKAVFSGKTKLLEAVISNPIFILVPFVPTFLTAGTLCIRGFTGPRVAAAIFFYLMAMACAAPFLSPLLWPAVKERGGTTQTSPPPPQPPVATAPGSNTPPPRPSTPAAQAPRFEVRADHTLVTRKLRQPDQQRASREECERACAADAECGGYAFDIELKLCAVHQGVGSPLPHKGTVVGIRR